MMKKLYFISLIFIILLITGCTYKTDYIKKYNDKLHIIFGDFRYEYLGEHYDNGYDGLGRHYYKKWQIYFTDAYGNEKSVILVNDQKFDYQIKQIYYQVTKIYLITEVLNEYFDWDFDKDVISNYFVTHDYYTKQYNYNTFISFNYNYNNMVYDSEKNEIKNYYFFNLTKTDIKELIKNGVINIQKLIYIPSIENNNVLSELEHEIQFSYLTEITKKINDIVPIEEAYYDRNQKAIDYNGEYYVDIVRYELKY